MIASILLPESLNKNGIKSTEETLAACMKTTTFVQSSHYKAVCDNLKHDIALLSAETEDIPDLFYVAYMQDKAKGDP